MTMEDTKTRDRPVDWNEQRQQLSQLVWGRVTGLQKQYCRSNPMPSSKAGLAQLRQVATGDTAWRGATLDAITVDMYTHVPDELYPLTRAGIERRFTDQLTEAETAVRSAMTLYAIHQQSRREPMHGGNHPGAALARLAWKPETSLESVRRRFASLVTAEAYVELSHHLRIMIRMLRDQRIPMEYGQLTGDLFAWQYRNRRSGVRLAWSRDFENNLTPRKYNTDSKGDEHS